MTIAHYYYQYLDSHPIWPENKLHRFIWLRLWKFYWRVHHPLARFGAVQLIKSTFFSIYIVGHRSKAMVNIYIGKTWLRNGRNIGKTFKFTFIISSLERNY